MRLFFALVVFTLILSIILYLTHEQQKFDKEYTDIKRQWYVKNHIKK